MKNTYFIFALLLFFAGACTKNLNSGAASSDTGNGGGNDIAGIPDPCTGASDLSICWAQNKSYWEWKVSRTLDASGPKKSLEWKSSGIDSASAKMCSYDSSSQLLTVQFPFLAISAGSTQQVRLQAVFAQPVFRKISNIKISSPADYAGYVSFVESLSPENTPNLLTQFAQYSTIFYLADMIRESSLLGMWTSPGPSPSPSPSFSNSPSPLSPAPPFSGGTGGGSENSTASASPSPSPSVMPSPIDHDCAVQVNLTQPQVLYVSFTCAHLPYWISRYNAPNLVVSSVGPQSPQATAFGGHFVCNLHGTDHVPGTH